MYYWNFSYLHSFLLSYSSSAIPIPVSIVQINFQPQIHASVNSSDTGMEIADFLLVTMMAFIGCKHQSFLLNLIAAQLPCLNSVRENYDTVCNGNDFL